jgi:hypothetical protein
MKFAEIQPRGLYWHTPNNNWLSSTPHWNAFVVRIDDPAKRYRYQTRSYVTGYTPDQLATEDPKGQYLRGIRPGDPDAGYDSSRTDRVVYVRASALRGEAGECRRLMAEATDQRNADYERRGTAQADAGRRRELLDARAVAAGLTGTAVIVQAPEGPRVRFTISEAGLTAFLDRLDTMGPECEETDRDSRGDCDGMVREYDQAETAYGKPRGSTVLLCASHAVQAALRGRVRRPGATPKES